MQALRSGLPPHRISVIPNAVDTAVFRPDVSRRQPGRVTIIVLSRLVYRKGIDLLVEVIPVICKRHPEVRSTHLKRGCSGYCNEKHALRRQRKVTPFGSMRFEATFQVLIG
jgi:phosphatidylinositol glycan class A protein